MFSTKRLKKKSQSVDIPDEGYAGSLLKDPLASPLLPSMARAPITEEHKNNTIQKARTPRRGELKRGYTIDTGQKKNTLKDVRRISFQRPKGTMEYVVESRDTLNSISLKFDTTPNELVQLNKLFSRAVVPGKVLYVPDPEYISSADSSPSLSPISPLSLTSSEADLEKATKDSDDAHRRQNTQALRPARVVSSTSEEEEALTEKFLKMNCKYITDGKGIVSGVLLVTPSNIMFDPHKSDCLVQERGCEEYGIMCPLEEVQSTAMCRAITDIRIRELVPLASTAPRSTEASLSEDVFTESELSPVRDDAAATSSDELQPIKSSGASSESVQTINQAATAIEEPSTANKNDFKGVIENAGMEESCLKDTGFEQSLNTTDLSNEISGKRSGKCSWGTGRERGKITAMRKTFISHASASMQQYAQRDRKHEYWFAVPSERSDHLYAFFVQWTPDVYGEGLGGVTREPGFVVVKKNQEAESGHLDKPVPDITYKDWEVVSVTEYYRRIDALNSEDLRSLCKRLQITTKEEVNSKLMVKSDPEPETFRPHLNEPSVLLQPEQIEKARMLIAHLSGTRVCPYLSVHPHLYSTLQCPDLTIYSTSLLNDEMPFTLSSSQGTIGYPWSLAFSTSNHGMSIKSLYRTMQGQDSPVLMIIKDSDGQLFGALASQPFKVSDGFYGTGETFLFTFCPDFKHCIYIEHMISNLTCTFIEMTHTGSVQSRVTTYCNIQYRVAVQM
ncbi:Oxidation resistance protein 1 [Triplophysa tibetana]|uniref:Oxidation resistance protein 1 n=1 Tax=Triplophysa tibetana TaxID=1572043 RepID=A0A5A9NM82_9TELE|nr:Oxidation resistance protein 1 [Triplophysa tibetana]